MKNKILAVLGTVLWCLYPVAFLLFQNLGEAQISEIIMPAGVFLLTGSTVLITASIILKSITKGSIVAVFVAFVFENFGFIENLLYPNLPQVKYWHVLTCCLFACIFLGYLLKKCPLEIPEIISAVSCLVAVVLIGINLIAAIPFFVDKLTTNNVDNAKDEVVISNVEDLPNIYWLTFDECSSFKVMETYYEYTNTEFIEGMENLGFNISFSSKNSSHKSDTVFSNYFNLNYVANDSVSPEELFELRKNSLLLELLDAYQYRIYGCGRLNELIGDDNAYVEYISTLQKKSSQTIGGESMADILFSQSVYYPFLEKSRDYFSGDILNTFDILKSFREIEEPTVLISYLMSPHEPFIFDEDGKINDSENFYNWQDRKYYRNQYIFITKEILKSVASIISNDPDAIIIVQSDHSARAASEQSLYRKWISVEDMRSILNCVYYKGEVFEIEGLSGVETLRKVMETALSVELPELLEVPNNE